VGSENAFPGLERGSPNPETCGRNPRRRVPVPRSWVPQPSTVGSPESTLPADPARLPDGTQRLGFGTHGVGFGYPRTWVRVPKDLGSGTQKLGFGYPETWVRVPKDLGSGTHGVGFGYPKTWVRVPTDLGSGTHGLGFGYPETWVRVPNINAITKSRSTRRCPVFGHERLNRARGTHFRPLRRPAAGFVCHGTVNGAPSLESPSSRARCPNPFFSPRKAVRSPSQVVTRALNPDAWATEPISLPTEPRFLGSVPQGRTFRDPAPSKFRTGAGQATPESNVAGTEPLSPPRNSECPESGQMHSFQFRRTLNCNVRFCVVPIDTTTCGARTFARPPWSAALPRTREYAPGRKRRRSPSSGCSRSRVSPSRGVSRQRRSWADTLYPRL
jgi:hypothetical protein